MSSFERRKIAALRKGLVTAIETDVVHHRPGHDLLAIEAPIQAIISPKRATWQRQNGGAARAKYCSQAPACENSQKTAGSWECGNSP